MKNYFYCSLICAFSILLTGCASIFSKSTYPVTFNSKPTGADLLIVNKKGFEVFSGTTPAIIPLKSSSSFFSKEEYTVTITMPGYKEYLTTISASIDGWYFGNILIGGFLGMLIIDPASGAMWSLDREYINVTLSPLSDQERVHIIHIDEVPEAYKDKLVKLN